MRSWSLRAPDADEDGWDGMGWDGMLWACLSGNARGCRERVCEEGWWAIDRCGLEGEIRGVVLSWCGYGSYGLGSDIEGMEDWVLRFWRLVGIGCVWGMSAWMNG